MRQPSDLLQTFHLHSFLWSNQRFPTRRAGCRETAPFSTDLPCHHPAWAGLPMCRQPCLKDMFKPQRLLPPQHLKTRAHCPGSTRCFVHPGARSAAHPGSAACTRRQHWQRGRDGDGPQTPCAQTIPSFPRSPAIRKLAHACYSYAVQLKPSYTYSSSSKMFLPVVPGLVQPTSPLNPWRGRHGDSKKPLHARTDKTTTYESMNESVNPESP